ncbi:hypothetical protein BLOT_013325 [Blomia tropicalis]|nr:hypothetical protein BLOT_013325 [Blomia tropicalis]
MSEQLEQSICDLEQKLSTLRLPHKLKQYRTYENQLQQLGEQIENQHGSVMDHIENEWIVCNNNWINRYCVELVNVSYVVALMAKRR